MTAPGPAAALAKAANGRESGEGRGGVGWDKKWLRAGSRPSCAPKHCHRRLAQPSQDRGAAALNPAA